MEVIINSKPVVVPDGCTLTDALHAAGVAQQGIATALNGAVVPAPRRAETILNPGDTILIIKAFYGG